MIIPASYLCSIQGCLFTNTECALVVFGLPPCFFFSIGIWKTPVENTIAVYNETK